MAKSLIKNAFPNLPSDTIRSIQKKISDKCSEFYFLDFLKTTKGNVQDAYRLFNFDERLRCLLLKYVLRFEIQIKYDFVTFVSAASGDEHFWRDKKYYIFKNDFDFDNLRNKIEESFANLKESPFEADSHAATYVMSFGTFVSVYKNINPMYKREFINEYTKFLPKGDFRILHKYLLCMRALRNRCAHGTHIVSNSFVNQLSQFSSIKNVEYLKPGMERLTVFELTLYFLMKSLHCKDEFCKDLSALLAKNEHIYSKYGGKQSINPTIRQKLFKNY